MQITPAPLGEFLTKWILANSIGWSLGFAVQVAMHTSELGWVVSAAIGGALGGAAQWLILRRHIFLASWWVFATSIGWAAGWYLGLNGSLAGATLGGLVGTTQWLVLQSRVPRAGWWILANIVGWGAGGAAVNALHLSGMPLILIRMAGAGAVSAGITGIVLVWLDNNQYRNADVWAHWVLATAAGWICSGVLVGGWSYGHTKGLMTHMSGINIVGWPKVIHAGLFGLVIGVMQWGVLRRYLPYSWLWLLVSAAGWVIVAIVWDITSIWGWYAKWGAYGLVIGVMQWLVLRKHISWAGWWVPTSSIAWAFAVLATESACISCDILIGITGASIAMALGGIVNAGIMGIVLVFLNVGKK